jgi:predicted O-methyltransferase YrrM
MNPDARLDTVESDPKTSAIAHGVLMHDRRASLHCTDAQDFLDSYGGPPFDTVFVDCRPGKFLNRKVLLEHLAPGGLYMVDDLLPQPTWPDGHQSRVDDFLDTIEAEPELVVSRLHWDSGLVIAAKVTG